MAKLSNHKRWKKRETRNILRDAGLRNQNAKLAYLFLIVSGVFITAIIVFFILALTIKLPIFVILLGSLIATYIVLVGLSIYFYLRYSFMTYFRSLFDKTRENYAKITNFESGLDYYEHADRWEEFQELNDQVDQINSFLSANTILPDSVDYSKLNLEYVEEGNKKLITLDSFVNKHKQFILQTELFRNAFIFLHYDVQSDFMTEEIYQKLYDNILKEFDVDNVLLARDENKFGYLVFVPYIDSLNCLEARLNKISENSIVSKYEASGASVAVCKIACVIYPYSDIKDILPDLRYASRQEKDVNLYLPKRLSRTDRNLYHTSLNLNNIAKIFESLSQLRVDEDDVNKSKEFYQRILRTLGNHIGFETVGIAVFNENKRVYDIECEFSAPNQKPLFLEEGHLDVEFVNLLAKYADTDSSFYFSKRSTVGDDVGEKLDIYAIKSGYFFFVKTRDGLRTVIYYLNREKDTILVNAYDKESLMVFSSHVAEFSRQINSEREMNISERRYRSILRLTDYNLYTINRDTHELLELSDGLMDAFGQLNEGDVCYKKLYGLEGPCKDCPLTNKSKKIGHIGKKQYSTSLILERKKEEYPTLLLSPITTDQTTSMNRYDPHLLIHSYYGFMEKLDNIFYGKNRGYILFAVIDNFDELFEKYGEEGIQTRLRFFFKNYRKNHKFGDGEVYAYKDNIFAFVFSEEGRLDILNRSETLYDLSQMRFDKQDNEELPLKCTYIGLEYPSTYNDRIEFIRHFERYMKENKKVFNQELFILPDTNYVRMASREKFIVSLLDNALQTESLSLKYLPECRASKDKIVGAEILLRLTDKYSNTSLNPYEFIPIASRNNRIGSITNYLIRHVGEIYQKYGLSAFKLAGMKNLSLNIDTTYFDDPDFLDKIGSLVDRFHLPKGFIHFEFNEMDIHEKYDLLKALAPKIKRLDIYLTADNYTGEFVSINKLKELGFNSIKISRKLVMNLSEDPTRISAVKSIIDSINEFGLEYCIVGLEDKTQYQLISEVDEDFVAEGYYFYEPLDLDVLLDTLRQTIK